jgi:cupin superfamily acireductone dioxygenase involved in methionine salvage
MLFFKEKQVASQKPIFVKAKQEVTHVLAKLDTANKLRAAAEKMTDANQKQIDEIQRQYRYLLL